MAEAAANVSLGGYDEEFVNALEDDLQCAICQLALKNPLLTKCGHRFCRQCLDEHFKSQRSAGGRFTCPVDRSNLIRNRDLFPDKATERKILSFFIHCPSEGCQWTGELRSKDAHLESCLLKVVSCTNAICNETMTRNNLQAHLTTTCPWRILQCNHCGVSHPACETEFHDLECRRKPLNCPKSCGAVIPREELTTHDDNDCPLTITPCPYAEMGCTTQVQRREIETHLQVAVQPHLDLACAKLNNTRKELNISQDTARNLAVRFTELENQLELLQTTFNTLSLRIDNEAGERVSALENEVDTLQTQFGNLEGKVDDLQDRVEIMEMILKDAVESKHESMEEFPAYTWTVTDFWEKVSRAKNGREVRIESDSFYLGVHGYKMKLRMFPNGVREGKNAYISLFVALMKGQYDAFLPWPFRYKGKFTVIDHNPDLKQRQNCSKSFSPGLSWIQRPKSEENRGYGHDTLLSHEELRKSSYVVDETLFIKFEASRCKNV